MNREVEEEIQKEKEREKEALKFKRPLSKRTLNTKMTDLEKDEILQKILSFRNTLELPSVKAISMLTNSIETVNTNGNTFINNRNGEHSANKFNAMRIS